MTLHQTEARATHTTAHKNVSPAHVNRSVTRSRLRSYYNIISALVLHDIKNRFFGSGVGQIVMVLWPFAHILVLIIIYSAMNRPHPYGESLIQYSAVSIFPFIIFNYVGRWIVFSAVTNKSFLHYPIIKPLDLIVARTLLETMSITIVGILLMVFVSALGYTIMPDDPLEAMKAVLGTLFLAIGLGFLNAPFAFIVPMWNIVITLIIIISWALSGVMFVASQLPEAVRTPLSYNPLLQCTEWFRSAYYSDYPTNVLDRSYVIECALTMMTIGLILNTLLKRFYGNR